MAASKRGPIPGTKRSVSSALNSASGNVECFMVEFPAQSLTVKIEVRIGINQLNGPKLFNLRATCPLNHLSGETVPVMRAERVATVVGHPPEQSFPAVFYAGSAQP
jgi:hypothetical protein